MKLKSSLVMSVLFLCASLPLVASAQTPVRPSTAVLVDKPIAITSQPIAINSVQELPICSQLCLSEVAADGTSTPLTCVASPQAATLLNDSIAPFVQAAAPCAIIGGQHGCKKTETWICGACETIGANDSGAQCNAACPVANNKAQTHKNLVACCNVTEEDGIISKALTNCCTGVGGTMNKNGICT